MQSSSGFWDTALIAARCAIFDFTLDALTSFSMTRASAVPALHWAHLQPSDRVHAILSKRVAVGYKNLRVYSSVPSGVNHNGG